MVHISAHGQGERFFRLVIDFIHKRSGEIFGNNKKYNGLLLSNLPLIIIQYKKGSLEIGMSQNDFDTNFSVDEETLNLLLKDFVTLIVDVVTKFEEPITFINGYEYIRCTDISYSFNYGYKKENKILTITSEANNFRSGLKGDKILTEIPIDTVAQENYIENGNIKVQYGNKLDVSHAMSKHCSICGARLPAGTTFCKNCGIDVVEHDRKHLEELRHSSMEMAKQINNAKQTPQENIDRKIDEQPKLKNNETRTIKSFFSGLYGRDGKK